MRRILSLFLAASLFMGSCSKDAGDKPVEVPSRVQVAYSAVQGTGFILLTVTMPKQSLGESFHWFELTFDNNKKVKVQVHVRIAQSVGTWSYPTTNKLSSWQIVGN